MEFYRRKRKFRCICASQRRGFSIANAPRLNSGPSSIQRVPRNHWDNLDNQRLFFDNLAKKLNFTSYEDWYKTTREVVLNNGGSGIMKRYKGSLRKALRTVYSDQVWDDTKFQTRGYGYWNDRANQVAFVEEFGKKMNIQKMEDWYKVKQEDFEKFGGSGLLHKFPSFRKLLADIYPNYQWDYRKFGKVATGYWGNTSNQRAFIEGVAKKLNIKHADDWYNLTNTDIRRIGGSSLLYRYKGSLTRVLNTLYPSHNWRRYNWVKPHQMNKETGVTSKAQIALYNAVKRLFPEHEIRMNLLQRGDYYEGTVRTIEYDICIPRLSLAFEYQGEPHYFDVLIYSVARNRQKNDQRKATKAKQFGMTLIPVPFWWDRGDDSLAATIMKERPDIQLPSTTALPIEATMPAQYAPPPVKKPNVPLVYSEQWNPHNWWMMEKYDGVRVYWNGSALYTKNRTSIHVPEAISNKFPTIPFDGELWCGPKKRKMCTDIVNSKLSQWPQEAKIIAFDSPKYTTKSYAERLDFLRQHIQRHSMITVVEPVVCTSRQHYRSFLQQMEEKGAEGLVLRNPSSAYFENESFFKREIVPEEVALVEARESPRTYKLLRSDAQSISLVSDTPLTVNTYVSIQLPGGLPSKATFISELADQSWTELSKRFYHFFVDVGKTSLTRCRGCLEHLPATALRVRTHIIRSASYVSVCFCLHKDCIKSSIARYPNEIVAPFQGVIWVKKEHMQKMPTLEGIQWRAFPES